MSSVVSEPTAFEAFTNDYQTFQALIAGLQGLGQPSNIENLQHIRSLAQLSIDKLKSLIANGKGVRKDLVEMVELTSSSKVGTQVSIKVLEFFDKIMSALELAVSSPPNSPDYNSALLTLRKIPINFMFDFFDC